MFCKERLGLDAPLGSIDRSRLNVNGSSLAAGHPFAATGARIVAGLAGSVAVIEAGRRSGALITADFGLELGRPVLAVPGWPRELDGLLCCDARDVRRCGGESVRADHAMRLGSPCMIGPAILYVRNIRQFLHAKHGTAALTSRTRRIPRSCSRRR